MRKISKLNNEEIRTAINKLDGWSEVDGKLHKETKFNDFSEAFAYMTRVSLEVHLMDHHPEWCNLYNKVIIDLVTHDVGGISKLDVDLAQKIDSLLL